MFTVLVCDDDAAILESLRIYLSQEGYRVLCARDGLEALEQVQGEEIHCMVLDIMMPRLDGLKTTLKLREKYNFPIILLSAKSEDTDKILGLNIGADDYVTKPFGVMELISRVKALLRRTGGAAAGEVLSCGRLEMDAARRSVLSCGEPVTLTYKEFELLHYLLKNRGIVLSRDRIMQVVWGFDFEGESRTVDMHIKLLRQKLGKAGGQIKTVRGVGYKLEEDAG